MKTRLRLCHLAAPVDMIQTTLCICGDGYDPAKPSAQPSPAQSSDSRSRLLLQLRPPALPPAPQLLSAETAWPAHLAVQPASPLPSPAFENCPSSLPGLPSPYTLCPRSGLVGPAPGSLALAGTYRDPSASESYESFGPGRTCPRAPSPGRHGPLPCTSESRDLVGRAAAPGAVGSSARCTHCNWRSA